jgi:UPF0755 protein
MVLGGAVMVGARLHSLFNLPLRSESPPEIVDILPGTSVTGVARLLHERNLISSPRAFKLLVRLTASDGDIRAGEYKISAAQSSREILTRLREGGTVMHWVTVPEGLRAEEVAPIVAESLALSQERFTVLMAKAEFIASLGVDAAHLEGYLLPETYAFSKGVTEEQVIRKMVGDMLALFDEEKRARMKALGMNLHQLLTLASIIEKEAGVMSEAPLIASVYHNRLQKKMRLQSDPTVIYGIEDFDGNLRRQDLTRDGPYNTYMRRGLPPTPIANPGRSSIEGALYPAATPYLYFVSRNDRTHVFSETLAEHNRAVYRYQRRRAP